MNHEVSQRCWICDHVVCHFKSPHYSCGEDDEKEIHPLGHNPETNGEKCETFRLNLSLIPISGGTDYYINSESNTGDER